MNKFSFKTKKKAVAVKNGLNEYYFLTIRKRAEYEKNVKDKINFFFVFLKQESRKKVNFCK